MRKRLLSLPHIRHRHCAYETKLISFSILLPRVLKILSEWGWLVSTENLANEDEADAGAEAEHVGWDGADAEQVAFVVGFGAAEEGV